MLFILKHSQEARPTVWPSEPESEVLFHLAVIQSVQDAGQKYMNTAREADCKRIGGYRAPWMDQVMADV